MSGENKQKIIVVVGPTASGKTSLGIKIANKVNGEIVSADSMQIYKNMPIASAAPTVEEMCGVKHHLIGFAEPSHRFSVAEYVSLATKTIDDIIKRGKTPIIVGGTGLYIDSLVFGISFSDEDNIEIRKALEEEFDRIGAEAMLEQLRLIDPDTAQKYHINDRKRIIRAFEIYRIHGKTKTEVDRDSKLNCDRYDAIFIGLGFCDREVLYSRINRRVEVMCEAGLVEEAKMAFSENAGATSIQAIGHKELFPYFKGEATLQDVLEKLKLETRHYAKRQMTWFRKNDKINWIYVDKSTDILGEALKIINERK